MKATPLRLLILAASALLFLLPWPASAADPCALLTTQEIQQVLGNSVTSTPIGTTGCMGKGTPQSMTIVLRPASAWARIVMPIQGVTKTDVGGIGDAASFSGQSNMWTLSVKQGANVIVLTVMGAKNPDQQKASELALARLALKRL